MILFKNKFAPFIVPIFMFMNGGGLPKQFLNHHECEKHHRRPNYYLGMGGTENLNLHKSV
jgi:hypothetical protein